ncbi:hypothetical protein [Pseudonocardia sp.]|jgi:hypothetical protein|uniref:hypothetical protein n=1 Tax=Pseudonocardia sp. TaxID=60912 RepID=UPI0026071305|nr:hypothetical protein [Pseudonocardia sp.]MCW2718620.1 hypothetical protein [Pseudonocardia sp.]MDT7614370.1 hypothetical protein [Pseudonocardiales bacterium]
MANIPDGGGSGLEGEIEAAQWRLWMAKVDQTGAARAAGGYVVDPERAQACIRELDRITADIRMLLLDTRRLSFEAPRYDPVSENVARNGGVMAARAVGYITAFADRIEATRVALQQQLDAYREVERVNGGRRA